MYAHGVRLARLHPFGAATPYQSPVSGIGVGNVNGYGPPGPIIWTLTAPRFACDAVNSTVSEFVMWAQPAACSSLMSTITTADWLLTTPPSHSGCRLTLL